MRTVHQIDMQSVPFTGEDSPEPSSVRSLVLPALGFLRRQWLIIVSFLSLALMAGGLYVFVTPPTYTATAMMMIDTRKSQVLPSGQVDVPPDAAWIESQIGILKSENVALHVVNELGLADDPEFTAAEPSIIDRLLTLASEYLNWGLNRTEQAPESKEERIRYAVGAYLEGLQVRRLSPSYLVRIDFHSRHPNQATKIANAIVDAYAFEQLNAKYQANARATSWLQDRLEKLREQTAKAEREVIEFRANNNIVSAGGRPMDQYLEDLNKQLVAARTHTAEVQARLARIDDVLRANQSDVTGNETVSDTLNNPIITKLRSQYLELVNREADWSVKYGRNHSAVVSLRKQVREIRRSIVDELGRIAETYKSELAIAKNRQAELEKELAKLVAQSPGLSQAEVTLRSLESAAQSYRKIYDDFLQRHTETVQQQSFPATEARLISPASVYRSGPRLSYVWLVTIMVGSALGIGLGALRELLDHVFRTTSHINSVLGTECLAMVPLLKTTRARPLLPREHPPANNYGPKCISCDATIFGTLLDAPSSAFAEAIRSLSLTIGSARGNSRSIVAGLTSCLANEGKSTVAFGLAEVIAKAGRRVILVDFDLRNPTLSRTLAATADAGLIQVVAGSASLANAIWKDPTTSMAFLPIAAPRRMSSTLPDVLASESAESLFETLRMSYDYVILDLPPLAPMADVRATLRFVDSYVLVIEWGRTRIDLVERGLSSARGVRDNLAGVVLNKVDMSKVGRYDMAGKYYYKTYGYAG